MTVISPTVDLIEAHHRILMGKNSFQYLEEDLATCSVILLLAPNIARFVKTTSKEKPMIIQITFIKLEERIGDL